jgi:hypothetical protein
MVPEKILEKVEKIIEDLRYNVWFCHVHECVKLFKIYGVTVTAYLETGEYVVTIYMNDSAAVKIVLDENGNVKRLVV